MQDEEVRLKRIRSERIARTKRLLRWLPRRANMHKYPVLRPFAESARKRHYLWSFRAKPVVIALYVGSILTFLPLYGVQMLLSVIAAFLFRANLPVLFGLQFVTNPFTILPVYFAAYQIGRVFLSLVGIRVPNLNRAQIEVLFENMREGQWGENFAYFATVFGTTTLGGAMIGLFIGTIASWLYRFGAYEVTKTYERLRELQIRRESNEPNEKP